MRAHRQHWIPPIALGAGQLAHGASWILLFALASGDATGDGMPALAWLHLVALGWLTLTALSVLVHVIPAFTDAPWKGGGIARAALFFYAAGVVALVYAFWNGALNLLPWAGAVIVLALLGYLIPAARTLGAAYSGPRVEAAIARALTVTLSALLVTAAIGFALTLALAGRIPAAILVSGPPVHATFGLAGWLTILIMGVSARTIRPISGAASRRKWAHVLAGSLQVMGVLVISAGLAFRWPSVVLLGTLVLLAGAIVYAGDVIDILRRATVTHRPPQAFFAAGTAWLLAALFLTIGALAGAPWGSAAVFVVLIGWVGQLVNAHIHHIGVRLIATIARGDDDETRPGELLATPLSWTSFALFQIAVAAGAGALIARTPPLLEAAALCGLAGWVTLGANLTVAVNRARHSPLPRDPRPVISLLG